MRFTLRDQWIATVPAPGRASARIAACLLGLLSALVVDGRGLAQALPDVTLSFSPTADTFVDAGKPTTNYGTSPDLRADGDTERTSYLRFDVAGLAGRSVMHARLRLEVTDNNSVAGGSVHRITNTAWNAATVTYNTRPAIDGPALHTLGAVTAGTVVEFNLDGAITGDGAHALAIDSTSGDGVVFRSANATSGQRPLLVLTVAAELRPQVDIVQPAHGATVAVGNPVALQGTAADPTDGNLGAAIAWRSDLDGPLGTGAAITAALSLGTHAITASVTNSGGLGATDSVTVHVIPPPPLEYAPLVDAFVDAEKPTTNYGNNSELRADTSPKVITYLRFAVTGVNGRSVQQARLRLEVTNQSNSGGSIHLISNTTWNEATVTYNTRPAVDGPALATLGPVATGPGVEFVLDGRIAGDGIYSFAIDSASSDGVAFRSSEATSGQRPVLRLTVGAPDPRPRVDIVQPANGVTVVAGDPVALQGTATDPADGNLGAAIVWRSDVDGALGTGGAITARFSLGTHTITASVTNAGGLDGTDSVTVHAIPPPPLHFAPVVDAFVDANNPTTNYGNNSELRADFSPKVLSYLRFAVTGVNGRSVQQARLQLEVRGSSNSGGSIHAITNTTWNEATVTYNTRPAVDGPALATLGSVAEGNIVAFDLGGLITGDGIYNLAIDSTSTDSVAFRSSEATSGLPAVLTLTVAPADPRPRVDIVQPADGATFFVGDPITMQGTAATLDDIDLDSAIAWQSNIDGPLGTGAVVVAALSEGAHTITASATNGLGHSGSSHVAITVVMPNTAPTVTLSAPLDGQNFLRGAPITCTGMASDLEDGNLTAGLAWTSNRDGALGVGASITRLLSVGTHRITVRAVDPRGLDATAAVTITVTGSEVVETPAIADAFVDAGKLTTNYGTHTQLRVDADTERTSYLRFAVTGIGSRRITNALLRLRVDAESGSESESGGTVQPVTATWQELTVTYGTRPAFVGTPLSSVGPVQRDQVVDFDVSRAVIGEGTVNLALINTSDDSAVYRSRETATPPRLALTLDGPTVVITAPADQTAHSTENPVAFSAVATQIGGANLSSGIQWRSSVDGVLGTGATATALVSAGTHRITARATDAWGATSSAEITLTVVVPPSVAIDSPQAGGVFWAGWDTTFAGSAVDSSGHDLSDDIDWFSDRDGPIGHGEDFARATLSVGTHRVSAVVADALGIVGRAERVIQVELPPPDIGFKDFTFGSGVDSQQNRATSAKPESKLWYHDGVWWATLYNPSGTDGHRIHALDPVAQEWLDTGTRIDSRSDSRQDVLWDGEKLYITSREDSQNRLYRYSYDGDDMEYTLDVGFPVNIPGAGTEALTIAKDSTNALWITYTLGRRVYVSATAGDDRVWGLPFLVPVLEGTSVADDDISGVRALPNKIGVFWSNQQTDKFYFALHHDGLLPTDPLAWTLEIPAAGGKVADDHFNLKLASDGRLFVGMKTSKTAAGSTQIGLLIRSPGGGWSQVHNVMNVEFVPTRPQCLLDETARLVYIFYSVHDSGIYYKVSDLDAIAFPSGAGTPFIESVFVTDINNPTTTKQNIDASTGIALVASSPTDRHYWHNTIDLP